MKFFIDTANLDDIKQAYDLGVLDGVTTNPSLMAKEGITGEDNIIAHYKAICNIVDNNVSAEVISTDFEGIVKEGEALAAMNEKIVVKVPMIKDGVKAIKYFSDKGIKTNVTLVFSAGQALLAAKAGATYVSPFIGRLDDQKGMHLVHHAMYHALNRGAQFVLLGSATDRQTNDWFWHEKHFLNDNPDIHLELSFNEELAHLIYAGANMMVVPSKFEPCGLTQLISLRYGTVPVVRGVGGLVSTVFDWDYDNEHPREERTGFVFYDTDQYAMESALNRAIDLYYNEPQLFQQLALQGMQYDYSWKNSGEEYIAIYDRIRHQ